ncbi:PREDICTED: uncharacterized protein LOC106812255 [Priapulus caudatus]|uniref:Uncharacterized protein LOC106812255 n=1 Tax=Priapulus caudatus TaxID=37621 RepID=A0ABM1EHA0_PRICU|nr:PREDICTED: uncharacterized protein LOC106812255 [Priapulus caudatus]
MITCLRYCFYSVLFVCVWADQPTEVGKQQRDYDHASDAEPSVNNTSLIIVGASDDRENLTSVVDILNNERTKHNESHLYGAIEVQCIAGDTGQESQCNLTAKCLTFSEFASLYHSSSISREELLSSCEQVILQEPLCRQAETREQQEEEVMTYTSSTAEVWIWLPVRHLISLCSHNRSAPAANHGQRTAFELELMVTMDYCGRPARDAGIYIFFLVDKCSRWPSIRKT